MIWKGVAIFLLLGEKMELSKISSDLIDALLKSFFWIAKK